MKMNLKPPLIAIKDAAAILSVSKEWLYAKTESNLKKQDVIFTHGGKSFFIVFVTGRKALYPIDSPPINIERIENNAASNSMATLIPWLCPDCAEKTKLVKAEFEKD